MGGRWYRLLACALVLVLVMSVFPGEQPVSAASISDKREELDELKREEAELAAKIKELEDTLEDQKSEVTLLYRQVDNLEKQLTAYEKQIAQVDQRIAEQEAQIEALSSEIADREQEMVETLEKLKKRVKAITKTGNYSSFQLLMNAESYEEYLLKTKVIACVSAHDDQLRDKAAAEKQTIAVKKQEAEAQKVQTEADRAELKTLQDELSEQHGALEDLYQTAYTAKTKLEKQMGSYESELKKLEKAEDDLTKEIEEMLKAEAEGGTVGTYGGSMYWPVPGIYRISSPYGQRKNDFHKGTDISASGVLKKPIVAAADGVVYKAPTSQHYSYGYYIILDHGYDENGVRIMTLYAHMYEASPLKVGDVVVGGQTTVGRVGNTGNSFGAHLHFEVREIVNGTTNRVDAVGEGYIALPK